MDFLFFRIECFIFAANLKLDMPYEKRMEKVEEIISSLKLEKCQNTKIGNALEKGISGGEKRRVSMGIELISDPSILFLDGKFFHLFSSLLIFIYVIEEPTSGLDSFTSFVIISLLKKQSLSFFFFKNIFCFIYKKLISFV